MNAEALRARLAVLYPEATTALRFHSPYEMLVATILAAQCRDERVNEVTPSLFRGYPDASSLARARAPDIESIIRSIPMFRQKTKTLLAMAASLVENHGGEVPSDRAALVAVKGIGRKTANMVLGLAMGDDSGFIVDTHVHRLAGRIGLSGATDPEKVEQDLLRLVPEGQRADFAMRLVKHGRAVCTAKKPACGTCAVRQLCRTGRTSETKPCSSAG